MYIQEILIKNKKDFEAKYSQICKQSQKKKLKINIKSVYTRPYNVSI